MNLPKLIPIISTSIFKTTWKADDFKKFVKNAEIFINKIDGIKEKILLYIKETVGGVWKEKDIHLYIVPADAIGVKHSTAFCEVGNSKRYENCVAYKMKICERTCLIEDICKKYVKWTAFRQRG